MEKKIKPLTKRDIFALPEGKFAGLKFISLDSLKSSCEFYLRYKDRPDLLMKEHPEYKEEIQKIEEEVRQYVLENVHENLIDIFIEETSKRYNNWLFELSFMKIIETI